ncbi:MAG: HlyD family efflux transporter periplasmic adaptor subunit [Planctomycetaceae bacterium]
MIGAGLCLLAGFAFSPLRNVLASITDPLRNLWGSSGGDYSQYVTEIVERGPFEITVTERGTIDSLRNATLVSKVEGATTIIHLVPEGTQVKEGDLLCELDSSLLVDRETQQQIRVTQSKAALDQAKEDVKIQELQNLSDIETAKLNRDLGKIDLEKFVKGDYEQQRIEMQSAVSANTENMTRATEYLSYLKRLVKKGYKLQSDLDAELIAYSRAENDRKVAAEKLRVLQEYTKVRTLRELEARVAEYERQIERTGSRTRAAMAQKEAVLKSTGLTFEVESNILERLQKQIMACKIIAPQDGQVVYANTREGGRQSDTVLVEIGATVRERQPIINLPDLDAMKVNARIHESKISMIKPGLTATVKIDAFATEEFHGEVDVVSSVPSSVNTFNRDLKEYEATVRLTDEVSRINRLRPGLNATLEILVDQKNDVMQTPVQSVISILDKRYVWALAENGPEMKEIHIGDTNERMVEILDGIEPGTQVIMNPRTQFSKEIAELESKLSKEHAQKERDAPKPAKPAEPAGGAPESAPSSQEQGGPSRDKPSDSAEPRRQFDPVAAFQRMDQNHDGKLAVEELSEPMRPRFNDLDTDHNGSLDQSEFTTAMAAFRGRGGNGGGRGRRGSGEEAARGGEGGGQEGGTRPASGGGD